MPSQILIKTFIDTKPAELDRKVNAWVLDASVRLLEVKVTPILWESQHQFAFTALYESRDERKAQPPPEGSSAPTVPAFVNLEGQERSAECMAGIFGVPEGWKLSPTDGEAAPVVCLSPDCDLAPYSELFGNVEEHTYERGESSR